MSKHVHPSNPHWNWYDEELRPFDFERDAPVRSTVRAIVETGAVFLISYLIVTLLAIAAIKACFWLVRL